MSSPLLSYTDPIPEPDPLTAGGQGTVTVVASYAGGLSDNPATDYVDVAFIRIDLGKAGDGGPNLTDTPSAIQVRPPVYTDSSGKAHEWGYSREGLAFTFTPPTGGSQVFPKVGLVFAFDHIDINDVAGAVPIVITEKASAPGDPQDPSIYPPVPLATRNKTESLGKFPARFALGDLVISQANGPPGFSPELSWSGSDAEYSLAYGDHFGKNAIKKHDNNSGVALQPTDVYPSKKCGDAPLSLQENTLFTLTARYVPDGSSVPIQVQRQVSAQVLRPSIVPGSFKASPQPVDYGEEIELAWKSLHTDSCEIISSHQAQQVAANSSEQKPPFRVRPVVNQTFDIIGKSGAASTNAVSLPQVRFNPLAIHSFKASETIIDYGQEITLSWDVSSAVSCLINSSPESGTTIKVKPTKSLTYTLDCHGALTGLPNNHQTRAVDVSVNIVSLSDVVFKIDSHYRFHATWSSPHATSYSVSLRLKTKIGSTRYEASMTVNEKGNPEQFKIDLRKVDALLFPGITTIEAKLEVVGPGPSKELSYSKEWRI